MMTQPPVIHSVAIRNALDLAGSSGLSVIRTSAIDLRGNERANVKRVMVSEWLTQGPMVAQFERALCELTGVRNAIACSSGTAALHLAMLAIGIGRGDIVAVPALTYIATANAVRYTGARVRFIDVDPHTWCLDPIALSASGFDEITAIAPVTLYDYVPDLTSSPFSLTTTTIEDAAHNPIARDSDGQPMIGRGTCATLSFYASKVIACGEGGALLTNDDNLAKRAQLFRGQGATGGPGSYEHAVVGYNYRMTDLHAAIGLAQVERAHYMVAYRRELYARYLYNLKDRNPRITFQPTNRCGSAWVAAVVLDRAALPIRYRLAQRGIETRPFFTPLPLTAAYRDSSTAAPDWSESVAQDLSIRGVCLPLHTLMQPADVDRVCEELLAAMTIAT